MDSISHHIPSTCQRILAIAERDPRRAVALARRQLISPDEQAWAEYTLGRALLAWERLADARPLLEGAAKRFSQAGATLPALHCSYGLLLFEFHRSANATLIPQLQAIATQFEQHGALAEAFRARVQLVLLYDSQGRTTDAQTLLATLAPERPNAPPLDQARWLAADGAVAGSRSDFATADAQLKAAEAAFGALRANIEQAKCWFQQAWLALQRGMLPEAHAHYKRAERCFVRCDLPIRQALLNRGMGLAAMHSGQYDEALRRTLQAQRGFAALGRLKDVAQCLTNLGNLYYYTGWWALAAAYYQRVEQLAVELQATSVELHSQRNRAMTLHRQGEYPAALALLRVVEQRAPAAAQHALAAEALGDIANVLANMGEYAAAIERYEQARAQCLALDDTFKAADIASDQGWAMLAHGDAAAAAVQFAFAAPLVSQHPANRWRVQHGLARCAEAQGQPGAALALYRAASRTVADLRGTLALEVTSSTLFAQAAQLHADALRCAAHAGRLDDLLTFDEWQRALVLQQALAKPSLGASPEVYAALAEQQRQIAALEADATIDDTARLQAIGRALESYSELLLHARHSATPAAAATPLPETRFALERLRAQLSERYGDNWTALVFARSADTLLVVTITPDQLLLDETPYDAELQSMLERATHAGYHLHTYRDAPFRSKKTARRWDVLHRLADRLVPPAAQARLHSAHRLLIVPTEQLHTLPWGALRLGQGWLAERAIVQQTPALSVWQTLDARAPAATANALLIGCGQFGSRADPLPATADELNLVAAAWPGPVTRLADAQATRAALLARSASGALLGDAVVHIATHATLTPEQGMSAHLTLWDDAMWLDEVAALRLGGALVTLSACEGAGADTLPGNEVLSLSWAFLAAGARTVLASLWPVADAVAPALMHQFYTALRDSGDAARALTETQRALIARSAATNDPLAGPLVWASFIVTGAA